MSAKNFAVFGHDRFTTQLLMDNQHLPELFKGQFIGMFDMNGRPMHEGDSVRFYYKGEFVICKIIYVPDWAMFCLQWPDGYKNKFPMNPEKYQVV